LNSIAGFLVTTHAVSFSVDIAISKTVSTLKKAIKDEKKHTFASHGFRVNSGAQFE
jgi:hypothetical protein